MVPLGLVILSVDIPIVRRWRRRATVAIVTWWRQRTWLRAMTARVAAWWRGGKGGGTAAQPVANSRDKAPLRDSSLVP
jgi:hypothetical protein